MNHQSFELGDFALQKGSVLPQAKLGYVTLGTLNCAKDNVVVCPTWFTATPSNTAQWLTGPGRALDPDRYFIVVPNHFGGAVTSSPSNTPAPFEKGRFPRVTTYDNVACAPRRRQSSRPRASPRATCSSTTRAAARACSESA